MYLAFVETLVYNTWCSHLYHR